MADSAKEEGEISDEEEATGILPENSHLATSHLYSKQTDNHGYSDANLSVPEYISPSQIGRINRKKHKVGTIRFLSQNTNNSEKTIVTKLPSPQKNTHLTSHALNKKQDFATLARNDIWNDQNVQQSPSSRLWDKRRLRSSKGDDISSNKREEDFQALLEKYKKIQDQLANIRQEEEAEVNGEQVENQVRAVPEADEENTAELRDGKKANGSQLEENLILLQTSSGTAIDGDKNGITEPEQTDDQDVFQTSTYQISTTEDDDDDLDELKLRRIALASAAEKIMRAELSEFPSMEVQDSVPEMEALPAESQSHAENKVSLPTQQDQTSKSGRSDQRKHPSRYSSSQRKDAKPYRPLRYRAPSVRPSRLHTARRNDSSHRDSSSRRTSSESHHRKEDSRRREADRQYTESERQRRPREPERKTEQNTGVGQTREIQRILTLDDPEEQVSRFLALINRKGADKGSTSSKSPLASLSLSESHLNVRGDDAVGAIPASKDNYNVEEMDIDSDPDSPAISTAMEELQFEPDIYSAMMPMYTNVLPVDIPVIQIHNIKVIGYGPLYLVTAMPAYMPDISPRTCTVTGDRVVSVVPNYQPEIPSSTPKPSNRSVEANTYPYEPEIPTYTQRVVKSIEPSVSTYTPKSSHISGHAENLAPDEYVSTPTNVTTPMEYAPIVTEYIPVPTIYVPAPNEHVPVPMEYVPAATGHVMDTSEYVPNTSEYVSDTSEYVPDTTEYVPDPPEYVPSGLASIPVSTEEYIPSPIVKQTSDGEDEEAILRAQLLRSLKRREKEKAEEQARSESPGSRSQSPSMYNSKPRKYQPQQSFRQKIHIGNLPIHKPVVINLGDDSSDEDDDYLHPAPPGVDGTFGGVDAGLKAEAAYDSSGTEGTNHLIQDYQGTTETQMRKQALKALEKQYENDCLKQSESILKDQALLKTLVSRASKYLQSLKVSEDTVDKLREQLAAAERVATAYTHQLDTMKKQANLVKNRLLKKKSNFTNLQKSLLTTGKELHGASYRPPSLVDIASKGKRQVQSSAAPVSVHIGKRNAMNFKVTIDNLSPRPSTPPRSNAPSPRLSLTPVKVGVVSTPATPPRLVQLKSDEEKVREKERLQKLAEDVESKLRQLRQSQLDIQERRGSRDPLQGPPGDGRSMKEIPRLDKIDLSTVTIDLTDDVDRPSKRRRSLMELNPSMKPDVKVKDMRRRTISDSTMEKKVSIKIPEGKALLRVLKLQRQNIAEELMSHGQNNNSILAASQGFDSLLPKVEQVAGLQAYKGPMQGRVTQQTLSSSSGVYRSPLLHFRSYRFSPYYRTKANKTLMSNSYAHKLLPKVVLCKFDLQGTCNDDKCRGQHMSGYSLSEREVLLDILSYSCGLAGVANTTPAKQVPGILGDYVDNMLKQNQGRLRIDELCLLLLSHVTDRAKHVRPHTMFYNPRSFRPKQDDKFAQPTNQLKEKQKSSFEWQQPRPTPYSQENVIGEQDVRYFFHADSTDIQDLESAVTTSPHDIHLWFKLASKKLNNPNLSREESLDHALNVLARGVEENKQNSDIWYRYLSLYSRHGAAVDFMDLCQTALQLAPSFHIWWLYLHSLATYTDRREVCGEIVDYLCLTQDKSHPNTAISHHLLEAMLYGANLSVAAGNVQYAANVLQCYFVKSEGKAPAQSSLTTSDRCVLWLAYIHLRSCGRLPGQLFDPADQMSGCIMCKETLIFPWHELSSPEFTTSQQLSLLQEAVNVCITSQLTTNPAAHKDGLVLYQNIIQLLLSQNRLDDMLTMCRDLLQKDQTLVDIWLSVANVYSASSEKRATQQVFADAEEGNPHTSKVFYYAAQYEILQNEMDKAIECLENCPLVYFDANLNDSARNDPLSFYCILLNQSLPLGYDPPPYRSDITTETIQAQQTYLWLNFCLFLELQGNLSQAVETYETALSSLSRAKDITLVWLGYLEYQYRQLRGSPQNAFESRKLTALLHRCLVTMPTKFEMPYWSDRVWTDYSYVDRVVDWYLKCLLPEQRTVALDRLLNMMPTSLPLVLRCCEESLRQGDNQRALSICYPPAYDATKNPSFWKLVTSLAIKQGSQKEVRRLFHKAVKTLPYSVSIWRDFLTFELTQGARSVDVIEAIVTQCQRLGVNMDKLLEGFPEISLPS